MSIFKLPRRRSPDGHLEHGVYVSMIAESLRVFHVDSKVNGESFHYVRLDVDDGDTCVSMHLADPRKLAADLIARADSVEAAR